MEVFQEKQQTIRCLKNQKKETEAIMSLDMEDLVEAEQEHIPKEGDIEAEVVLTLACAGGMFMNTLKFNVKYMG